MKLKGTQAPNPHERPRGMTVAQSSIEGVNGDSWIINTGASHHMSPDVNVLTRATLYEGNEKIIVGNGEVKQLCKDNHSSFLCAGQGNMGVVSFAFLGHTVKKSLWHQRLGHPSNKILAVMLKDSDIVCNPDDHVQVCSHYEATRFVWIFPLINKLDVLGAFVKFCAYVENQFHTKIKVFQSDGGGEFLNTSFKDYLEKNGILHYVSCPYTPQQNGMAERKHRHLLEIAITILSVAKLTHKFCSLAHQHQSVAIPSISTSSPASHDSDSRLNAALSGPNPLLHGVLHSLLILTMLLSHQALNKLHKFPNGSWQCKRRLMLSISRQLDVKNAFLHVELQEEVYMKQPQGFVDSKFPAYVCKLVKSLYGLKQAPRAWNDKFTSYLQDIGFQASLSNSSLFGKTDSSHVIILLLYVDDIIITGSNSELVQSVITNISEVFDLKDMGKLAYFLGLQITYKSNGDLFINQGKYAKDVIQKAGMDDCKSCLTPCKPHNQVLTSDGYLFDPTLYRSLVGGLQSILPWLKESCDICRLLLKDLHVFLHSALVLYCDNQFAIALSLNPMSSQRACTDLISYGIVSILSWDTPLKIEGDEMQERMRKNPIVSPEQDVFAITHHPPSPDYISPPIILFKKHFLT
ncbi:uncharacterized protein [Malus domestica]|uniref:uncharacterized protein n=1 Tax=Malus domestica TaxID=3750 RepID=UPI0039760DA8